MEKKKDERYQVIIWSVLCLNKMMQFYHKKASFANFCLQHFNYSPVSPELIVTLKTFHIHSKHKADMKILSITN